MLAEGRCEEALRRASTAEQLLTVEREKARAVEEEARKTKGADSEEVRTPMAERRREGASGRKPSVSRYPS